MCQAKDAVPVENHRAYVRGSSAKATTPNPAGRASNARAIFPDHHSASSYGRRSDCSAVNGARWVASRWPEQHRQAHVSFTVHRILAAISNEEERFTAILPST
ncbi:DUF6192 family protein [Streptomyces sp. NPDC127084]|uniref:DUF6192 family protein n=1 Tax=Streptomyces sp. NPDC127084 TaxID=3347133 RepID=UPI00364D01B5